MLFRAADGTFIPASADHIVDTRSATTVGAFGVKVRSIEHLMAALGGLGIDNVLVDTDAEELPAADGSAKPFVDLIESAGRASLPARAAAAGDRRAPPRRRREPLARGRAVR